MKKKNAGSGLSGSDGDETRFEPEGSAPLRPWDPDVELPAAALSVQRKMDLLVQLVGRRLMRRLDLRRLGPAFLEWYAREARETLSKTERTRLTAQASDFADRFLNRRLLASNGVEGVDEAPERRPAPEWMPLDFSLSVASEGGMAPLCDLGVAAGVGRDLWSEPCGEWLVLPEGIPNGRYLGLTVRGDSMVPLLHSGDVILIRLGPELEQNAVVVVRHPETGYVVKRVGVVSTADVELRSFNPEYPAIRVPRDPSLVLGTVVLRWCTHTAKTPAS